MEKKKKRKKAENCLFVTKNTFKCFNEFVFVAFQMKQRKNGQIEEKNHFSKQAHFTE